MISHDKNGGRTIHLYIPFEYNNQRIETITFGPLRFGHTHGWSEGKYENMIDLMLEMAGIDRAVLFDIRYPDANRVFDCFMEMLTPEMRNDVVENNIPRKREEASYEIQDDQPRVTNGSGAIDESMMVPPGVPLPEAGFDMSEEP